MATKRKRYEEDCVFGYVHKTTDVRTAKHSSTRYFSGFIQTSVGEFLRYVCFSPEKHEGLLGAERMKSPVKISNVNISPRGESKEIIMSKSSNVAVCQRRLDFSRSEQSNFDEKTKVVDLGELTSSTTMCSVKATVVSLDDVMDAKTKYGNRKIRKANLADASGTLTICFWEDFVNTIHMNRSYLIENIITSTYQGELQLNSTSKTRVMEIDPIQNVKAPTQTAFHVFQGTVLCCSVKATIRCLNCAKNLDNSIDGMSIVKCTHCFPKQRVTNSNSNRTVHIQIVDEDNIIKKFVGFNDIIAAYLSQYSLENFTLDELDDHFLNLTSLRVSHKPNSDIIVYMDQPKNENDDGKKQHTRNEEDDLLLLDDHV